MHHDYTFISILLFKLRMHRRSPDQKLATSGMLWGCSKSVEMGSLAELTVNLIHTAYIELLDLPRYITMLSLYSICV